MGGEHVQNKIKDNPRARRENKANTMDDGDTTAGSNRGRSKEPRPGNANGSNSKRRSSSSVGRTKKTRSTSATPKRLGRPPGSKNKPRSLSGSKTPKRKATTKTKANKETPKDKTGASADKPVDFTGETGRAIKQEIMDNTEKVQQTLDFPIIDLSREEGQTSASKPCVINDDDDNNDGTQDTDVSNKSRTPKRKQSEMTKGIAKVPNGTPKKKAPQDNTDVQKVTPLKGPAMTGRGRGRASGRGGGGRGGRGLQTPPRSNKTAGTEKGFTPQMNAREKETHGAEGLEDVEMEEETSVTNEGPPLDHNAREAETEKKLRNRGNPGEPGSRSPRKSEDTKMDEDTPVKKGGNAPNHKDAKATNKDTTTPNKVQNPYKPQGKSLGNAGAKVTYAAVTKSPQKKIKTHSKIKEAHKTYFEATFIANEISNSPSMEETVANHKAQLKNILLRAKEIDRKAKINTWQETSDLPTISKVEDIPDAPASLSAYLFKRGSQIKRGKNRNWQVKITTHITCQEFIHHWGLSKRDYTKVPFVTLRSTPVQAPSLDCCLSRT